MTKEQPLNKWKNDPRAAAFGAELRNLRRNAGLTSHEIAAACGWSQTKTSFIENGSHIPSPADIRAWVQACNGAGETEAHLLQRQEEIQAAYRSWKTSLRPGGHAAVQAGYNELNEKSRLIRNFSNAFIPSYLQTADYARQIFAEMIELHQQPNDDVEAAVSARLQRQALLYDTSKTFEFLIDESVLRRLAVTTDVMRAQLDRLQSIIGVSNVRFGILPLGIKLSTTPQNSFDLFDEVAIVETFNGETILRDEQAQLYARVLDRLWEDAVEGEQARQLINKAREQLNS